jgi:hypothetical protein
MSRKKTGQESGSDAGIRPWGPDVDRVVVHVGDVHVIRQGLSPLPLGRMALDPSGNCRIFLFYMGS